MYVWVYVYIYIYGIVVGYEWDTFPNFIIHFELESMAHLLRWFVKLAEGVLGCRWIFTEHGILSHSLTWKHEKFTDHSDVFFAHCESATMLIYALDIVDIVDIDQRMVDVKATNRNWKSAPQETGIQTTDAIQQPPSIAMPNSRQVNTCPMLSPKQLLILMVQLIKSAPSFLKPPKSSGLCRGVKKSAFESVKNHHP